ncbi:MAG: hypothetical protein ACI8ZM_004187 [Crocinitomix sp.]|jgi:hypothetical protein
MKNTLLIILIFVFNGVYAQDKDCNFTMEIQGNIVKDSTYSLLSLSIVGIKKKHQKELMDKMGFGYEQLVTLNVNFFEEYLAAVCLYRKFKLTKVMIGGDSGPVQLLLIYEK